MNILRSVTGAVNTANQMQQMQRQNALMDLFAQHGAGIAQGNPAALAAYAALDPMGAYNMQTDRADRALAAEDRAYNRQRNAAADARANKVLSLEEQQMAQERIDQMGERERQMLAQNTRQGFALALPYAQQGDWQSVNKALSGLDLPPVSSMNTFMSLAAASEDILPMLEAQRDLTAGPKPGNDYERYVAREQAAGRVPVDEFAYAQAKKGQGLMVELPDGTRVMQGGPQRADPADASNATTPAAMISSIDGILSDPALDFATGWLAWTQNVPGTDARRFGARARQLNGQAFLQAFESLKGAGGITESEGAKATEAIGRLDTAQRPEDYRAALTELRDILATAIAGRSGVTPPDTRSGIRLRYNPATGDFE